MPNRIIKDSIRGSDDLAAVSADAERLFWRLVVSVDDFGRFDARPKTIIGQCLTAFLGSVTADKVKGWLLELEKSGLLQLYVVDDRPYLVLTKWSKHQRARAKDSKFPSPDNSRGHPLSNDSKGGQARSNACLYEFDNEYENENEFENDSGNEKDKIPKLAADDELNIDIYCQEIEMQMVVCGSNAAYKAQGEAFKWIKQFHQAKVPIDFIRRGIVQAYAKKPDISTFTYCAKVIKDEWERELLKQQDVEPMKFEYRAEVSTRAAPQLAGRYVPQGLDPQVAAAMEEDDARERDPTH